MASYRRRLSNEPDEPSGAPVSLVTLARKAQQARINCSQHFPKNVFRDSAWDIMLELFICEEMDRAICVKEVMTISGDSATGTIRRLESLEEAGLTRRCHDPRDHRRMLVKLDEKGRVAMISFLHHLFDVGSAVATHRQPTEPVSFKPQRPKPRWDQPGRL
jgi:DNA-binding MarR family transcriptional regulator